MPRQVREEQVMGEQVVGKAPFPIAPPVAKPASCLWSVFIPDVILVRAVIVPAARAMPGRCLDSPDMLCSMLTIRSHNRLTRPIGQDRNGLKISDLMSE